jgi:ABC transporter substrate binding protein
MARAQPSPAKIARVGFVGLLDNPIISPGYPAFLDQLKKSGFGEGQNLAVEAVKNVGDAKRFFADTADLPGSNVDVLVAIGPEIALQAAVAATHTLPIIVWAMNYDPIARGFVKSLTHPGGNITGVVFLQTDLAAKQVELLTQALPGKTRLALLWDELSADQFAAAEHVARSLHLDVQSLKLENPPYNFDAAFARLSEGSPQNASGALQSAFFRFPRAYCRTCDPATAADDVHLQGLRPGGRTDLLRHRPFGQFSSGRVLRRQNTQRREARRSTGRAGEQV